MQQFYPSVQPHLNAAMSMKTTDIKPAGTANGIGHIKEEKPRPTAVVKE